MKEINVHQQVSTTYSQVTEVFHHEYGEWILATNTFIKTLIRIQEWFGNVSFLDAKLLPILSNKTANTFDQKAMKEKENIRILETDYSARVCSVELSTSRVIPNVLFIVKPAL